MQSAALRQLDEERLIDPASLPRPIWDGRRFRTPNPDLREQGFRDVVRWMKGRRPAKWEEIAVDASPPLAHRIEGAEIVVQWVGHSTLLIQTSNLNILTDPIWSPRCSPFSFAGPKRVAAPGVPFDQLPSIDLVLLSHDHYDHFDLPTIRALQSRHRPVFVVPSGVAKRLRRLDGAHVVEIGWWESTSKRDCRIVAVPAQHHSGRGMGDRYETLWCGFVIETPSAGSIYFAGDTGWWQDGLAAIGQAFGDVRLAAIPIGAYSPRWFMSPVHIDPAQAVDLFELTGAAQAVAIHHSTFQLSDEPMTEPAERLGAELERRRIAADRFRALRHGESWRLR